MNFFSILHEMSKRSSIYVAIPDTLIFGYGFSSATLFTTDPLTCELIIKESLSNEAIIECFKYFEESEPDKLFPIALFKVSINPESDHSRVLFTAQECQQKWFDKEKPNRAIQKFIRNNNTIALIKCNWDSLAPKLMIQELIKHKNVKIPHEEFKKSTSNVKKKHLIKEIRFQANRDLFQIVGNDKNLMTSTNNFPALERKVIYLVTIFERYFLRDSNLKIMKFDSDWIEDNEGTFYLMNVKKYRIAEIEALKSSISLFNVPKVPISAIVANKPRPSISIKKKIKVDRNSAISKSQTVFRNNYFH